MMYVRKNIMCICVANEQLYKHVACVVFVQSEKFPIREIWRLDVSNFPEDPHTSWQVDPSWFSRDVPVF